MDTRYLSAVGRIRAKEARLIEFPRFLRMLEATGPGEVIKEMADTEYAGDITDIQPGNFEQLLLKQQNSLKKLLTELTKDPELTDLLFMINDFHNLKVAFKEKLQENPSRDRAGKSFLAPAVYDGSLIWNAVIEDNYKSLPEPIKNAAAKVGGIFERTTKYNEIDIVIDRFFFGYALDVAARYKSDFMKNILSRQIDNVNIKTFIKFREAGVDRAKLKAHVINGGELDAELYDRAYDGSSDDFMTMLRFKGCYPAVKTGFEHWQKEGDFSIMEKLMDDLITGYVKKAKYETFGIEPVIGYFFAIKAEITNIRSIMTGKLNEIPDEYVRERLRTTYV